MRRFVIHGQRTERLAAPRAQCTSGKGSDGERSGDQFGFPEAIVQACVRHFEQFRNVPAEMSKWVAPRPRGHGQICGGRAPRFAAEEGDRGQMRPTRIRRQPRETVESGIQRPGSRTGGRGGRLTKGCSTDSLRIHGPENSPPAVFLDERPDVTLSAHSGSFEHMYRWRIHHTSALQTANCVSTMSLQRGVRGTGMIGSMARRGSRSGGGA